MKKSALKFLEENKNSEIILRIIEDLLKNNIDLNINEISKKSFISTSGVTRFFTNHGFDGFKEFKYLLLNEYENIDTFYLADTFENEIMFEPINETKKINSVEKYEQAFNLLENAKKVYISVIGGNNSIGFELQTRLERMGYSTSWSMDTHLNYVKLTNANPDDVLFAISYSGESIEVVNSVNYCKKNNIKVISITRIGENSISKNSDITFFVDSTENLTRILSLKSRTSMLYIIYKLTLHIYFKDQKKYNDLLLNNIYKN